MRSLCIFLTLFTITYIHADLMDSFVMEALRIKTLIGETIRHEAPQNQQKKARLNKSFSSQNTNVILKPTQKHITDGVKFSCVSPLGSRAAYVITKGRLDSIFVTNAKNPNKIIYTINGITQIKSINFFSNDSIIFTCLGSERYMKLIYINLLTQKRTDISPIKNAKFIHIISEKNGLVAVSYDGKRYRSNKINIRSHLFSEQI